MSPVPGVLALLAVSPSGGAPLQDIGIVVSAVLIATMFLLVLGGIGHRAGLVPVLGWFARFAERVSGQPAWASLPCGLAILSLLCALFGLYWDVSLHIDVGRDPGPLNNTAHYFILVGLFGIFASGFFAVCLPDEERPDRPGATSIRIAQDWYAPLGGIFMMTAGLFALIAFPLDDLWHRLFGQDVTLWGPTHLMLIGGASSALIGIAIIQIEVRRAVKHSGLPDEERLWVKGLRNIWLPGGVLVALSAFQGEFDFGIAQFQLIFHPILIMLAAGLALVAARVWLGPGTAIGAVLFFLAMRGGLTYLVGPVLGESTAHFPLYLAEGVAVELIALAIAARERPIAFAVACGVAIGSAGLAAEWAWSHAWTALPWPSQLLGEAVLMSIPMAIAASLVGAWLGARLGTETVRQASGLRLAGAGGAALVTLLLAIALFTSAQQGVSGAVTLRDVQGGPKRTAIATVALQPADAAKNAKWLTATAWQGGGLVVDRLRRIGAGVYRSTRALPVYGDWKTMIRLHSGDSLTALPIYAPIDAAIPVPGVSAPRSFSRPFVSDRQLLQREAKTSDPTVSIAAYSAVLALTLSLLAAIAWGVHRVAITARRSPQPAWQPSPATSTAPPPEPAQAPVPLATTRGMRY
jgi:hypothetical protein